MNRRRAKTPEYAAWISMRRRCSNPKVAQYADYGGRGIKVCPRWESFKNFLADMGERPTPDHQLDRQNNDGHYEPTNCKWSTRIEQMNNRRSNRRVNVFGKCLTVAGWARETGIHPKTIAHRLDRGWTPERALTAPPV